MSKYTRVQIGIPDSEAAKIKKVVEEGKQKTVTIRIKNSDIVGDKTIALTKSQISALGKAMRDGTDATLILSMPQLRYSAEIEGGFIGALLPILKLAGSFIASKILPSLATGALAGVGTAAGTAAVNKITGNGVQVPEEDISGSLYDSTKNVMYINRDGIMPYKITALGKGLYLAPWRKGSSIGKGLYLKTGSKYTDATDFVEGTSSPFIGNPLLDLLR
jgi:hypothetical protein